jgi:hypothetical protein
LCKFPSCTKPYKWKLLKSVVKCPKRHIDTQDSATWLALVVILPYYKNDFLRYLICNFFIRIIHTTPCYVLYGAVYICLTVLFFCTNFISFNFPSLENNFIFHFLQSVPENMANFFTNTPAIPDLPISKIRPIITCLILGNFLNLFLLQNYMYFQYSYLQKFCRSLVIHEIQLRVFFRLFFLR